MSILCLGVECPRVYRPDAAPTLALKCAFSGRSISDRCGPKKRRESTVTIRGEGLATSAETWSVNLARNNNKRWTPEEDERLLLLRSAGESPEAIALTLKRTAVAVDRRFYTLRNRDEAAKKAASKPPQQLGAV
jgi:hypothetical protein